MYAERGLMLTYSPNPHQEVLQYDEFCCSQKTSDSSGISICGYNLWGGGDLFKAPEPVIEQPVMSLDPMTAALSMISCGEDAISPQSLTVSDIESSIMCGQILSEVFYECRKDLLEMDGNETPLSEVMRIEIPNDTPNVINYENTVNCEGSFQKSVSSHCLHQPPFTPCFLDYPIIDFDGVNVMRRAFSEGDIKTLIQYQHTPVISEERKEKLMRYRNKKSKRNFGRKIKYACRKALADSQPRIHGRFAKTEG